MPADPIVDPFDHIARRRGGCLACVTYRAGQPVRATIADLDHLAVLARREIDVHALEPGTVVGLTAPDGPAFLAGLLALRRAGLVALLLEPTAPDVDRRRTALALGAAGVLSAATGWPTGPDAWRFAALDVREPAVHPGAAVIKLTSGSTGRPRGVVTPAEALAADDDQLTATMGLHGDDALLSTVPLGHSYGLSSLALPVLRRGAPLIFPEPGSPFAALEAAAATGATFFPTTPAWLSALLRVGEPPAWPATLRLTISAGARLDGQTAARFREVFGRRVHTFYGSSECGGICFDRDGGAAERGTVGVPVDGVRVLLDPVDGEAGEGSEGLVAIESAAVASGYAPDPDPRLREGRFVTGDLGTWSGGEIALRGRADDLINVRGKKVSPREVEDVLRSLAGVEDVAVVGVPVEGTGGHLVRAVVAAAPGRLHAAEVAAFCRARLAPHKVPRSIALVEQLPRTVRGKLDRAALVALAPASPGHQGGTG